MSRPGIEPGSHELASCAITARPPQLNRAIELLTCFRVLVTLSSSPALGVPLGFELKSGAREETGKFSGTSKNVSRPGIEFGSQELASCAMTVRPPQHDTTGPCHKAFDVFQGSCYNFHLAVKYSTVRKHEKKKET